MTLHFRNPIITQGEPEFPIYYITHCSIYKADVAVEKASENVGHDYGILPTSLFLKQFID